MQKFGKNHIYNFKKLVEKLEQKSQEKNIFQKIYQLMKGFPLGCSPEFIEDIKEVARQDQEQLFKFLDKMKEVAQQANAEA